jgi:hypothetical protein
MYLCYIDYTARCYCVHGWIWRSISKDHEHERFFSCFYNKQRPYTRTYVAAGRPSDRGLIPAEAKGFSSSLCVQTGSRTHPSSCTIGTGGRFPGVKRGRGVTPTTHLHVVPRSWISTSYTSSPLLRLYRCVVALIYPYAEDRLHL